MGMPEIPDFSPHINIDRKDAINLLLTSIALEELSLAHIMNAEGEKLQKVINDGDSTFDDLMEANSSVERMLRNVIKKEMLLQFKLEDVIELIDEKDHDEV
ncbi:hypothetical protein CR194_10075 [Salipaludibacillus keqinensis]|uniref:Uncharacterized protein n=1 Tax=Salipaludibacillus keqinensis TaxID=2045207 RepID=A0A323TIV8_9BACI|nr:hypothetical protein [Salipaludibacillus keqinensis]PYZ93507.1 hypothetical protein CR194_10075 [Salipaludibacillus keqinensis]